MAEPIPGVGSPHGDLARIRSMLFVPGNRASWLAGAAGSGTDAVVADLEDSVPPGELEAARAVVSGFLASRPPVACVVRTHDARHPAFAADLMAAVSPATRAIVLPKVTGREEVLLAAAEVGRRERDAGVPAGRIALIVLIESARAIVRLPAIVDASPRIAGTMFAGADGGDLVRDLGATWSVDPTSMLYARSRVLLESRAGGLPLIMDSVFASLADATGFREDTLLGRSLGYTGRPAIHPSQVPVINHVYSPTAAEARRMRELLAAYEKAVADGAGATTFQGTMIDFAMAESARAVLARLSEEANVSD